MKRKGAGTVLPIGFAIMIVILSIITYMASPQILAQEGVRENFVDALSFMTSIVNIASKLPGTVSEKAAFIDRSLDSLSRSLSKKGIFFTYSDLRVPLRYGEDNIVILYTLSKGDSCFVGFLATNLTDLQSGIGSSSAEPSFDEGDIDCKPIKSFPGFIVLYSGFLDEKYFGEESYVQNLPLGPSVIKILILNMYQEDYNLTMSFAMGDDFDVINGTYINFQPFRVTQFDSLKDQLFYLSGRGSETTGIALLHINPEFSSEDHGYLNIELKTGSETVCSEKYSIEVFVVNDWERYRELQFQAIEEGMQNLFEWLRAGSDR
ncbi:MAG: hypothetical protein DRN90_05590 [Thermoproteota archaeon]|nr:MAG: hypothetical protein DRN90_05590 [Candidatus Korarchaeota archaeon]